MIRTLTVICPVYNEEEVIASFHAALRAVLDRVADRYRSTILFVVDRSADRTEEVLRGIAAADPAVRILFLSSRFGHQHSLLAGIDHADGDAIVMMDSDLQHPPEVIPALLAEFERGNDVVYTVRLDSPDIGLFKRVTSKLFYRLVNTLSDVPIHESAADFRLLSRRVADVFRTAIRERGMFLRGLVSWVGFRSAAVPFEVRGRGAGRSKYSLRRMVSFAIDGVLSFSKRPLKAAIAVGMAVALGGLVHGGAVLLEYLRHAVMPSGWATLAILVSVLGGVQLVFLGVVGQYIGAIFDEVKGRPHYLVDARVNFDAAALPAPAAPAPARRAAGGDPARG